MTEIEPCPKCGALPCDWTDNPHTAPSGVDALIAKLKAEHQRNGGQGAYAWRARELCGEAAAAIAAMRPARGVELAETGAVIRLTPRLLLDRMLPSGAGLDDAPDSKIVAMYLSLGELRGLRGLIAALRQAGEG